MSQSKKLIPRRRFGEFSENWRITKLSEITKITMGQSPDGVNYTLDSNNHILVQGNADIQNGKVVPRIWTKQVTKIANVGDIIYTVRAPVGDVARTDYRVVLGRGVAGINGNDFIYQLLNKMKQDGFWNKYSSGSTFDSINYIDLSEALIKHPDLKEQTQIGEFFKKLDNLINTQQKKLEKAKTLKSAYLTEMFPNEGESKPRLRFSGSNNYWQCLSLGDLTNIKTGDSDAQDSVINGAYPFFVRSENIERSNRYLYDGEAILIPGEGRLGEIFHYIKGKFDYHQRVYKISDFREDINGKFVFYYMQKTFKKHALKYTVKATVDSLRLPMLTDYLLLCPSLKEQNNISSFFQKLDNKIALEQKKLDKLKNIKQAYLNEMFV